MTDEMIIQLFWDRREEAIKETEKRYGAYCFKIAQSVLQNKEDSEECLNDALLQACDKLISPLKSLFSNNHIRIIHSNFPFCDKKQQIEFLHRKYVAFFEL